MKGKPVIPPVYLSATYKFDKSDDLIDVVQQREGYIYSRWDNPSVIEAEKTVAAMEGYEKALAFGSGMAAISSTVMAHVKAGDRIVATRQVYGATFELLNDVLPGYSVETTFVNCWETDAILEEIAKGAALLYLERVSFSQADVPVEFLRIYYRGDRYALYSELQG